MATASGKEKSDAKGLGDYPSQESAPNACGLRYNLATTEWKGSQNEWGGQQKPVTNHQNTQVLWSPQGEVKLLYIWKAPLSKDTQAV